MGSGSLAAQLSYRRTEMTAFIHYSLATYAS